GGIVLQRRRVAAVGADNDGVVHRAGVLEVLYDAGDVGLLLADGDVDADDPLAALVDDRVQRDLRLAGLAVADDQLALAAADRRHGVNRLDAGLQGHLDRLATSDARRGRFDGPAVRRDRLAAAVARVAQRVHDAPQHRLADRHLQQRARRAD